VCLLTASVDHFRVLDKIFRSIQDKIICRRECILITYSKAMLLLTEHINICNSAYDTDLEGNVTLQ